MRNLTKGKRNLSKILSSLGVSFLLLSFFSGLINAQCGPQKDSCSSKNLTLSELLEKKPIEQKKISERKNHIIAKQEEIISVEKDSSKIIDNTKQSEKKLENPGVLIVVMAGFIGMYFYFNDKKKKKKK
ncbi:MAG: hypothetical protein AB1602_01095 [Elusimicrobiota bacterium]